MTALLLYACVRDELFTDRQQGLSNELVVGKNRELTVAAAKEWYVNNEAPVTRMGVTQSNVSGILVTPSWNHAKEWKKGRYEVVEASLRSNMNVILYDQGPSVTRSAFMDDWATYYGTGEFGGGIDYSDGGDGDGFGGSDGLGDGNGDGTINGGELDGPTITAPSCYWIDVEVPIGNCNDNGNSDGGYIGGGGGGTSQKPDESDKKLMKMSFLCRFKSFS